MRQMKDRKLCQVTENQKMVLLLYLKEDNYQ